MFFLSTPLLCFFLILPQAISSSLTLESTADGTHLSQLMPSVHRVLQSLTQTHKNFSLSSREQKMAELIQQADIHPEYLKKIERYLTSFVSTPKHLLSPSVRHPFYLPQENAIDHILKNLAITKAFKNPNAAAPVTSLPKMSVHGYRIDVIEEDDDWSGDDLYVYTFVTDGVVPTGKVSKIYRRLHAGDSFFLDEVDRVLYPVAGILSAIPQNHLIIDYGIVESEGRDIEDMRKLTEIISHIAVAYFTATQPAVGAILSQLRQEVVHLANLVNSLDVDDRLVTNSLYFSGQNLVSLFQDQSFSETKINHKGKNGWSRWEYNIHFRFLQDQRK
jgi:hypothetical protein